jgi:hypothetical protein
LAAALTPLLAEAGQRGGTAFERDTAVVLRRLEAAARRGTDAQPPSSRALLELLSRVIRKTDEDGRQADTLNEDAKQPPRLIVP